MGASWASLAIHSRGNPETDACRSELQQSCWVDVRVTVS